MEINMYDCGFGDCFRLREDNLPDLYVDFGSFSRSRNAHKKVPSEQFDAVISQMDRDADFLLTHYHEDHFSGAIYMAEHTEKRFTNVYISDVWDMRGGVDVTSLTLLRGIFTKSVMPGGDTLIHFLQTICKNHGRIHFISRWNPSEPSHPGLFHHNRYVALWPDRNFAARKAQKMIQKLQHSLGVEDLEELEVLANRLNQLVVTWARNETIDSESYLPQFRELNEMYSDLQRRFDEHFNNPAHYLHKNRHNIQYKLNEFGNEISIVFQNVEDKADGNILFTGDFGKRKKSSTNPSDENPYWPLIERNLDGHVAMHPYYKVIKLPHHGTSAYYHSFTKRIDHQSPSLLMAPNKYIGRFWAISPYYIQDSSYPNCSIVCASDASPVPTLPPCYRLQPCSSLSVIV